MADDDFNPQDQFVLLCEDCRLGLVGRPEATFNPDGTRFVPHRPDCDPNVPCFYFGADSTQVDPSLLHDAYESMIDGTFALPYERFAVMTSVPPHHRALQEAPKQFLGVRHNYIILVEQISDDTILFHPFMRNSTMKHWARQVFELKLTLAGEQSVMMCQALDDSFPEEFLLRVQDSLQQRMDSLFTQIHRLMAGHGRFTEREPSATLASAIAKRRAKATNPPPPIQPVRIIDLESVTTQHSGTATGTGGSKRPHWRRGTWVREHLRRGKVIPAGRRRGTHVRGGGAPPWYEIRQ